MTDDFASRQEHFWNDIAPNVVNDHIEFLPKIHPDLIAFHCDVDVDIPVYDGCFLQSRIYLVSNTKNLNETFMYRLNFNEAEPDNIFESSTDTESNQGDYTKTHDEIMTLTATQERIPTSNGNFLTFPEYLGWVAINTADDEKAAEDIFLSLYREPEHKPRRKRKSGGNVKSKTLTMTSGPITNALMGRNTGHIEPVNYFLEKSCQIPSGSGGFLNIDIRASNGTDIDAPYTQYQLSDRDRFWLDALYTLAIEEGKTTIEGSEILTKLGYANPYAKSSFSTMQDAFDSINKAVSTRIEIDVTDEKRNKRKRNAELIGSISLQPIVNAIIEIDFYQEEKEKKNDKPEDNEPKNEPKILQDFTVRLQTPDPIDSLPIAKYEKSRKMFVTVTPKDFAFKTIKKLTTDDRQMWAYVLRVIKSEKLSSTIIFETMWRNLEIKSPVVSQFETVEKSGTRKPIGDKLADPKTLERRRSDAERKQKERMLKKLEKMLDEKKGTVFKSWRWKKDGNGAIVGISIVRNA